MRSCGILMHITSLPSPYGIGTFGAEAEAFVDWLREARQKYWQMLPIGPTGYGDSPYQSFSTFAGNPLMIDLDELVKNGLITKEKCMNADYGANPAFVDFEKVYNTKMKLLNEAFKGFEEDVSYLAFIKGEADWLEDYALFMALKEEHSQASWQTWEPEIKQRLPAAMEAARDRLCDRIAFWKFIQFEFYLQWEKTKRYANKNGIQIIGDIPIYVAPDSADVWASPELFQLTPDKTPRSVAGVPPDYFSKTGQLWGNPLYDWAQMKKEKYSWWVKRIEKAMSMFDLLRIDHFRAFDTYYSIPYGEETAINGKWENGPGMDLWNEVRSQLGNVSIIAEDLGDIFDSVKLLLRETGFPGMRVLQFGFNPKNENNDHLCHSYISNCVAYSGTHDNSTAMGWLKSADSGSAAMAKRYLKPRLFERFNKAMIRNLYQSAAGLVIIPMQDVIGLDDSARMNIPSTLGGNWQWRITKKALSGERADYLSDLCQTYFR